MATTLPRPKPTEDSSPRVFPIWPGACVALILAGGLVASEIGKWMPRSFVELGGGAMSVAHAMTAFAAITLIGDATVLSVWERELAVLRDRIESAPARLTIADDPEDMEASRAAVWRADRELTSRHQSLIRLCLAPAYIAPMIGFVLAARPVLPDSTWFDQGGPLFLSLFESGYVVLLGLGVSNSARVVRLGWLSLMLGPGPIPGSPEGGGPRDDR
jgi:hypothetical protein